MITRLYANDFLCLAALEAKFDCFGVLCGPNGSGKSSVFDALRLIRNLGTGDGVLGGDGDHDFPHLEFAKWQKSTTQEFELGVTSEDHAFEYLIHIKQKADFEQSRIVKEHATCDGKKLFARDLEGVSFNPNSEAALYKTAFPTE